LCPFGVQKAQKLLKQALWVRFWGFFSYFRLDFSIFLPILIAARRSERA
jgi:hypothetical protein